MILARIPEAGDSTSVATLSIDPVAWIDTRKKVAVARQAKRGTHFSAHMPLGCLWLEEISKTTKAPHFLSLGGWVGKKAQ